MWWHGEKDGKLKRILRFEKESWNLLSKSKDRIQKETLKDLKNKTRVKEGGITGSYKKAEYDLTGEERGRVQIRIKTLQQHT